MFLKKKKNIFAILLLFLFLLYPKSSQAIGLKSVAVMPAYPESNVFGSDIRFTYNLDLGEEKRDGLRIVNNGEETVVVKAYSVDAATTPDGSYGLLPEDDPISDIGGWIKLSANEVEIGPLSEKTIPFIIKIPPNVDAGDHFGGLIMEEIKTLDTLTGTGVKVVTRVGIRVQETVPGEIKRSFTLTSFDYRYVSAEAKNFLKDLLDINRRTVFHVGVKNDGNIKIKPKASLKVKNIFGITVANLEDRDLGEVFPRGENSESTVIWNGAPLLGRYTAEVIVDPKQDGLENQTKKFVIWAFPYRAAFIFTLIFILLVLVRLIAMYFREASKEKMPIYKVKLGDNLADLGQRFFVSWKKIAKMNFIGQPYEIKENEKLFIPVNRKNQKIMQQLKEQGEFLPSIVERSGRAKFKKKRTFIIIIIFVLIGAGVAWGIKLRRDKVVHQEIQVPQNQQEAPKETAEKTKTGAYKKSNVKVKIVTLNDADKSSSEKMLKKMQLIGYNVGLSGEAGGGNYTKTTIAHSPEKKERAEMVKNDIKFADEPDMIEVPGLESDVVIYNFSPVDNFFFVE